MYEKRVVDRGDWDINTSARVVKRMAFYKSIVPAEIPANSKLKCIETGAFMKSRIHSVILPESICTIMPKAFKDSTLENIKFPKNCKLKVISSRCFECTHISDIIIPASVERIDEYAFHGSFLNSISFENESKIKIIGEEAFSVCRLENVEFPVLRRIEKGALARCSNLKSVIFKGFNRMSEFPCYLLNGCCSLEKVEIPKSITKIRMCCFEKTCLNAIDLSNISIFEVMSFYCSRLESVIFDKTTKEIHHHSFGSCNIKYVTFDDTCDLNLLDCNSFSYASIDTFKYYGNMNKLSPEFFKNINSIVNVDFPSELKLYHNNNSIYSFNTLLAISNKPYKRFNVRESIKNIFKNAFYQSNISYIFIPSSVESIDESAFQRCKAIKITFAKNSRLTIISKKAFNYCENLQFINLPQNLKVIEEDAFSFCPILKKIVFPESLVSLEDRCFSHCDSLKEIYIPKNVEKIGISCFSGSRSIKKVTFHPKARIQDLSMKSFEYMDFESLILPEAIKDLDVCNISPFSYNYYYQKQNPRYLYFPHGSSYLRIVINH